MSTPSTSAFQLLHPGVRRQLWDMKWPSLRPLQVDAIHHLLKTDAGHAILSAGTAGGKTEAAFLPILSRIADEPSGSVRAIYVGPLKALINDQFARLEQLCTRLELPVHRWHGDVPATAKARLIKDPGGVLLITPESLESIFVNRSRATRQLFGGLRFVVIDELHAFLDNERGLHLRSLLHRVERLCERPPRIVGLSATLGAPTVAKTFVGRDASDEVMLIVDEARAGELLMKVHTFVDRRPPRDADDDDHAPDHERRMVDAIVGHCRGKVNLVFANRRDDVEAFGHDCAEAAARLGLPDAMLVHHGSLAAEVRRDAELTMKAATAGATAFCTSTLEMGIDIGGVEQVGQIGPPFNVASLKQRVGRSGRRDGASRTLRVYLREKADHDQSDFFDRLHLNLVQTIAVSTLMLDGWVEPPVPRACDLSTLTQQVISRIAERGAAMADTLFDELCRRGAFRDVDAVLFAALLRQLGASDVIEQDGTGELILGLAGEAIRKDRSFYAAFPSADQWSVLHSGDRIGGVDGRPDLNDHLLLSRRRWRVVDVDDNAATIYVVPARGRKNAIFGGSGGGLHEAIVARMRKILGATDEYAFLDAEGATILSSARRAAIASDACRLPLIATGPRSTAIMTWAGSSVQRTLAAWLSRPDFRLVDESVGFSVDRPIDVVRTRLTDALRAPPPPEAVAEKLAASTNGKYDLLLGLSLRGEMARRRELAMEAACRCLTEMLTSAASGSS